MALMRANQLETAVVVCLARSGPPDLFMYSTSTGTLATAWTLSKEAIQSVVKGLLNHIQRRQAVSTD